MKNWKLFLWAVEHCKFVNDKCVKCFRNNVMMKLMKLSGVTPADAFEMLGEINHELCQRQGLGS